MNMRLGTDVRDVLSVECLQHLLPQRLDLFREFRSQQLMRDLVRMVYRVVPEFREQRQNLLLVVRLIDHGDHPCY